MKFLRHLGAVLLVVAVIVGLGMLWAHASGGGTSNGTVGRALPRAEVRRLEQVRAGVITVHSDDGPDFADASDLIRTCEIEAALAVVVIAASAIRRHRRRKRRAAAAA